jgi:hypothetical protein
MPETAVRVASRKSLEGERSSQMAFKALTGLFGSKKPKVTKEYQEWRELMFSPLPTHGEPPKSEMHIVHYVIMDIGQFDQQSSTHWAISMKTSTGEASFQPTVGRGVFFNVSDDRKVAQAAREIVQIAQGLLPQTNRTKDFSLPEPGIAQFFFITIGGVHGIRDSLDQFQKPENPYLQLLNRFGVIQQFADQILKPHIDTRIKALYVVAFTPAKMDQNELMSVTHLAMDKLKAKDSLFKQRVKEMPPEARLEITNLEFIPAVHTPANMQTLMGDWLKNQYNVTFNPTPDNNFFLHGMRNPQGRQNIFLFYFDME